MSDDTRRIADELRVVAAFGLNFARPGSFDAERWELVLAAAARLAALNGDGAADDLLARYHANHFDIGPMASGEAAVFHEGRLLLIRRSDDGLWALPGGITDPGETLARTAQRELWEETGLVGRVVELLGVFDSRLWQSEKRIHFYHAVFRIEVDDPQPRPTAESGPAVSPASGSAAPSSATSCAACSGRRASTVTRPPAEARA